KLRVLLQRRDAAAAWLCCNAAGPLETLHPDHHHAGADPVAFGRLAPRGTGLNLFNHSGTQVDGIGLRHRSLQKRINAGRLAHWESAGNPTDSSRAKFALVQKIWRSAAKRSTSLA